jgi:methyltransferase family protein
MPRSVSIFGKVARLLSRQKDDRDCVLSHISKDSVCAEIGVYKGEFSELILARKPKKLHAIDPWKFEPDPAYESSWYGGSAGQSQANMDTIYESVLRRFRAAVKSGTVEVHRCTSVDAAGNFPDNYFDWIYIDGNHQYEFVKQDLGVYLPKVKTNGLVAGDDYGVSGWWQDGVTKAVDEAVASGRLEKLLIENHQYLLRKI